MADRRLARGAVAALGAVWLFVYPSCSSQDPMSQPPQLVGFAEDASGGVLDATVSSPASLMCMNSAGCLPGQVCCLSIMLLGTSCQHGPCPTSGGFGSIQLCEMSAECLDPATTCSVSSNALLAGMGITSCNAPSDAGSDAEGGLDSGTTEAEASSIEDASEERSDGTSPGDGAPPEAAGDP